MSTYKEITARRQVLGHSPWFDAARVTGDIRRELKSKMHLEHFRDELESWWSHLLDLGMIEDAHLVQALLEVYDGMDTCSCPSE
ncbi:MAG: hypothetical protein V3W43_11610 [Desulfatiglandaceae bacterium]